VPVEEFGGKVYGTIKGGKDFLCKHCVKKDILDYIAACIAEKRTIDIYELDEGVCVVCGGECLKEHKMSPWTGQEYEGPSAWRTIKDKGTKDSVCLDAACTECSVCGMRDFGFFPPWELDLGGFPSPIVDFGTVFCQHCYDEKDEQVRVATAQPRGQAVRR
jgi:hypothetical protein